MKKAHNTEQAQYTNLNKMVKNAIIGNLLVATFFISGSANICSAPISNDDSDQTFLRLNNAEWKEVFFDSCTENWKTHWHLDGLKAKIDHSTEGMEFKAGPIYRDDSSHAVLWTKGSFKGDIKIEYEYTKTDTFTQAVTIIYVQATGCDEGPFKKDIFKWNDLRIKPAMRLYFDNMNTYHISYAAFPMANQDPGDDYIRARRYMPLAGKGLTGTELEPDYSRTGLFKTGVPYQITIIKRNDDLFMNIHGGGQNTLCHWKTSAYPPISEGRIGLRHMFTRAASYRDFRVSVAIKNIK